MFCTAAPEAPLPIPAVRAAFRTRLGTLAAEAPGSSTHVARVLLLAEPPSIDAHEMTDKGSINQRAVLRHRAAMVAALYATPAPPWVIAIGLP